MALITVTICIHAVLAVPVGQSGTNYNDYYYYDDDAVFSLLEIYS